MNREMAMFVLGVLAISITAKAAATKECNEEPPYCTVCRTTWGFLRDILENQALAQTTADIGKVCTCGYIPDKNSALYKQCSDHMDQVPAKLLAFAKKTLGDPSVHCGFACGQSAGHARNASLPACSRIPTPPCSKPDDQLCSVCKASVLWTQQLLANKDIVQFTSKYMDVYCNLATNSCQQNACHDIVGTLTFKPIYEVASFLLKVVGDRICTPFCQASPEVSDVANHAMSFLRGVANLNETRTRK